MQSQKKTKYSLKVNTFKNHTFIILKLRRSMTYLAETDKINIEKSRKISGFATSEQIVTSRNSNW